MERLGDNNRNGEYCRLFYFSRKWFDIGAGNKAVSEAVDSLQRGMDEMKSLREDL